jgi:hypothetical protein
LGHFPFSNQFWPNTRPNPFSFLFSSPHAATSGPVPMQPSRLAFLPRVHAASIPLLWRGNDRATLDRPPLQPIYPTVCYDRTSSEGVRRQDQLERFSAKREHNQHIIVHYHIIHSSKSYYNLGSCIRYIKRFKVKTTLKRLIRVCGNDFSLGQDIPFLP